MVDNLYFIPLGSLHPIYSMGSSDATGTSLGAKALPKAWTASPSSSPNSSMFFVRTMDM